MDIWNDEHNQSGGYDPEIWNQPIVSAGIEVQPVSEPTRAAVVGYARMHGNASASVTSNAHVKLVVATATWGVEAGDDWEDGAQFDQSTWNMYLVTAADGRAVAGFMAYELADAGVANLPLVTSEGLADYMAIPIHALTDAALSGAPDRLLGTDNPEGARFRFLVGTVLARGIPEPTRAAFEAEAFAPSPDPHTLAARYPGIANAYSPEQWHRALEPRLGPGRGFGAVWTP